MNSENLPELIARTEQDRDAALCLYAAAQFRCGHALATGSDGEVAVAEVDRAQHRIDKLNACVTGLKMIDLHARYKEANSQIREIEAELERLNEELPKLSADVEHARARSLGENIPGLTGATLAAEMKQRKAEANDKFEIKAAAHNRLRNLQKQRQELVERRDDLADEFRDLSSDNLDIENVPVGR